MLLHSLFRRPHAMLHHHGKDHGTSYIDGKLVIGAHAVQPPTPEALRDFWPVAGCVRQLRGKDLWPKVLFSPDCRQNKTILTSSQRSKDRLGKVTRSKDNIAETLLKFKGMDC